MTMISFGKGLGVQRLGVRRWNSTLWAAPLLRGLLVGEVGLCLLSATASAQTPDTAPTEPDPAAPGAVEPTAPAAPADATTPAPEAAAPAELPAEPQPASPDTALAADASLEVGDVPREGLDEVVVTVDRRTKNLQKYSGTAAAFSQTQLSAVGIGNVRELSSVVPGLRIGVQEGNTEVYIRGIGSDNNTELGDEAVALHLDGIYLPRPRGVGSMFFDVERVEVNSGPQGTLRGRNAVGGSVNIVSAKPKLGEFGANAEATFGTFAQRRYEGMLNIPIGDTLAVRAAAFSEVHDPYYENAGPLYDIPAAESADTYAFRAQIKWQATPQFSVLAAYDYTAERGTGYLGSNMQAPLTAEDTQAAADLAAAAAATEEMPAPDPEANDIATPFDIQSLDNPRRIYQRGMNPSVNLKHQGARLELTYDAGPVIVEALGSYRDLVYDQVNGGNAGVVWPGFNFANPNTPDNFSSAYWHTTSKSTIAELRLYAPDTARLRWAIGGFYFNEDQYAFLGQTSDPANGFGGGEFNMPDVKGGSMAGYADATFDVTEVLRVLGGARITTEHKSRKNGLWALWVNPGNLGRFGTEGFRYAMEDRTIFGLPADSNVTQRVNAFLNGIKSFGARDNVAQSLCADPPAPTPGGPPQTPRVRPSATGGIECTSGINPALLQQEADFNAGVEGSSAPFNINMIPQNDEIEGNTFFDWRVGGEYDLGRDSMLYATVTTGHKAGGFNDTIRGPDGEPQNPPQYTPESVISFEIGSKNQLLDRRLRLNASAFLYRYEDQVFQTIVTVTPDNPNVEGDQSNSIAVRQNAKNTTNVMGLDLDITYSLPLGLEAEVHALLMDARFSDNTIVNDSRIGFDVTAYRVDIGGNWLPRASPFTLNYTLSQFLPTEAGIFHWLISGQTVGKHYMSVYNGEGSLLPLAEGTEPTTRSYLDLERQNGAARLTDVVDTYTRFDLGAGWKHPDGRLAISGFVNNLTNLAYATSIISTPGLNLRFFNPPRTAGVRVRVDW